MPKETNKRTARQKDADELHMTSTLAAPSHDLLVLIEGNIFSIDTTLDISLSAFRDALRGASTKDFSTLQTVIDSIKDTDGIKKITDIVKVYPDDADTWNIYVRQDAKDRTVTNDVNVVQLAQLVPFEYDYISLGYTGDNLTGVVYKAGGAGGATVATLTLAYTNSRLDSVTRT